MNVKIYKNDIMVFESDIHAYSITDNLTIGMYGQYKEVPMVKDEVDMVEIVNDDGSTMSLHGMFIGYQFRMSTYEKTNEEGIHETVTGVTINDLAFKLLK